MSKKDKAKPSCINCAYCVRHTFWAGGIHNLNGTRSVLPLEKSERDQIKINNFDFMKKYEKDIEDWEKELAIKKQKEQDKKRKEKEEQERLHKIEEERKAELRKQNPFSNDISLIKAPFIEKHNSIFKALEEQSKFADILNRPLNYGGLFGDSESAKYKMLPKPILPELDRIRCYKKQWNLKEESEHLTKVPNKSCEFYFDFFDCQGLEMDGIETKQIRQTELDNIIAAKSSLVISKRGLWISGIALFVSILTALISIYMGIKSSEQSDKFNKEWRKQQIDSINNIKNDLNKSLNNNKVESKINKVNESLQKINKTLNRKEKPNNTPKSK